jgi:hypothetical protein
MVEPAEREPTMEEIVVALRETRRRAGRTPPPTVVGGQTADSIGPITDSTDITILRDAEIARLLSENARLNERVVFLLKVIEREQERERAAERPPEPSDAAPDHSAMLGEIRAAIETELRPVLAVLLRLLERQRADVTESDRPDNRDAEGIVDLDALHS